MEWERPFEKCIRDENGCIAIWQAGYSEEDIEGLLAKNPGWYRSRYYLDRECGDKAIKELASAKGSKVSFVKEYFPEKYREMVEEATENGCSSPEDYLDYCNGWINSLKDTNFGALFIQDAQENTCVA